jgi:hypothetical protein
MFPIRDENPVARRPMATYAVLGLNLLARPFSRSDRLAMQRRVAAERQPQRADL